MAEDPKKKADQIGSELGKAISDSLVKAVSTAFNKLDFSIIGKQIGQGLVPELNKVVNLTDRATKSTNNYFASFGNLSKGYQKVSTDASSFFDSVRQRTRDLAKEKQDLLLQESSGLQGSYLERAILYDREGKFFNKKISLLKQAQQRELDSVRTNEQIAERIRLSQEALTEKYVVEQEIQALERQTEGGLKRLADLTANQTNLLTGQFAVREQLIQSATELSEADKQIAIVNLLKQQKEFETLTKKRDVLYDLKRASDDYAQALKQANADIDIKKLTMKLGLTEDETSQLARQYAEQNKINGKGKDLTAEQIKSLQAADKQLRHKREEVELIEYQANWQKELNEEVEEYAKSWEKIKSKITAIVTDPKVAKAFFAAEGIKTAIEGIEGMEKRFDVLKKSGLSAGQAAEGMVKTISVASVIGLSDTEGVMQEMVDHYGNVNALSGDMVDSLGKMAVHMGITGQEAMKLNAALSRMPGETAETAKNAMEHVGHMAEMEGIAPGKIMKDMAANTAEMARAGNKGAEAFGKSVIALHKMGIEMGTASKIADSLLDFETSINNQMEASALLGKEINLDKARELALNNDLEGATAEVVKNIGGAAEFNKLNRLQQDALAKSLGMTVEEMTKYIDAQEEQEKYHGKAAGFWMNAIGYSTEYGSKVGGFLKEHGLLLISGLNLVKQTNIAQKAGNALLAVRNGLLATAKGFAYAFSLIYDSERRAEVAHWIKQRGQWALEKAHLLFVKAQAAFGVKGAADKAASLSEGMKEKVQEKITSAVEDKASELTEKVTDKGVETVTGAADKTKQLSEAAEKGPKAKAGEGVKNFLTNLAEGLKAMGTGKVLAGAFNLIPTSLGLVAMIPGVVGAKLIEMINGPKVAISLTGLATGLQAMSTTFVGSLALSAFAVAALLAIPSLIFLAGVSLLGVSAAAGLTALGAGLAAFGATAPVAIIGIGLIALLGASMIPLAAALLIATPAIQAFGTVITNVLQQVPAIIDSVATGFEKMMTVLADNWQVLIPVGLGLGVVAYGLGALGIASLAASPGLFLLGVLLPPIANGLMLASVATSAVLTALPATLGYLSAMAEMVPSLMGVAGALVSIAAGLSAIALAGVLALPALGALTMLGVVAPGLTGALGGKSETETATEGSTSEVLEEKLDLLIDEIRGLKMEVAKGGVVYLDSRKVGDTIRLFGVNSSGIR